jgi:signal peptidase II
MSKRKKEIGQLRWLWLTALFIAVDSFTKAYFLNHFIEGQSVKLLPFLNFTLLFNKGAAFSLLGHAGGWQQWLFGIIALVISLVILFYLARAKRSANWVCAACALILAGAVGNLYDRVVFGFVVDFIDFHVGNWHWPVFNVADSAICIGVAILFVDAIVKEIRRPKGDKNDRK